MGTYKNLLSLVIPVCNEEKTIAETLDRFTEHLSNKSCNEYEIIIIVNVCNEGTINIVETYAQKNHHIRYKEFKHPLGKGRAVIEGFKMAGGEILSFVDADGAIGPIEFLKLVKTAEDSDGAIGSRWLKESKVINYSLLRTLISKGFNILVRFLFGLPFKDTQCGAKVFKKYALKEIVKSFEINNFAFDVELLYKLYLRGYNIKEMPIRWVNKKGSTVRLWRDIPVMFLSIMRLRVLNSPLRSLIK